MSGRTFPKKNSGKMNRERRYGKGGRDEEGHNGHYDGYQAYRFGEQNEGGEGERREERSGWNRVGAGRNSEDKPSTHRQRGLRYGDYSRRSHRNEGNAEDRDLGDRRREDRDRGYVRNGGKVSRYDPYMNGVRGNRRIQHDISPPSREKQDGPKVARLRKQLEEGSAVNGETGGSGVATPNNLRPPRQQSPPPPPPPQSSAPAIAAPVPRRGKTIITEARDYSDEDDNKATVEETERKQRALAERKAKIREQVIRQMKEASTPPGSPPPFL
ncbi:hypothetical protein CAEBREN_02095 [Caenorhabditis brenneri]|uniref:Uncharacterized protein n=1 Tax=Caenorhabditis brenneri TaxID=135651 RepID=G0NNV0_CAEBE|nr:hypothetical protein CAEBREN_02095 [Caenorhabditis brenneri]